MRLGALLRLEVLAPAVLIVSAAAEVGLRCLPLDRLSFRSWEALRVGGEDGPFRPNHRYENPRAYGDLANMGNRPDLRQYHAELVVTDRYGFRNPPGLAESGSVRVILTGSSFSAGTEVGEEETLAARLAEQLGVGVYNAALAEPDLATFREIARRVGLQRGVLVFEYLEGRDPPAAAVGGGPRAVRCPFGIGDASDAWCRTFNRWYERHRVSPLHVLSNRMLRRLQNDRWFPNPDREAVLPARLTNGREMLFQGTDHDWRPDPATEARAIPYFTWLDRRLDKEGLDLVVVLVPRKYTVYGPLLARPDSSADVGAVLLGRIEAGLGEAGVPVVNLVEPLRRAARAELGGGRYVYFLDDTHWNALGIATAAASLTRPVARVISP